MQLTNCVPITCVTVWLDTRLGSIHWPLLLDAEAVLAV